MRKYFRGRKESYYANRRNYFPDMIVEMNQEDWEHSKEYHFGELQKVKETNDYDSVLSPHWENRAALKARVEKELKLDVSHLD